ncbi:MAG: peptide-N-glycosidase F-related protein [Bacteroidia bacterium]
MKKILLGLLVAFSLNIKSNPGDTTWVQANINNLEWYGNYDTLAHFPNGSVSYRKILMLFTLGEHPCPAGSTYCHQWDYTVLNYVLTPTDTIELSRFITPYANTGVPRFPSTWKQHYWYDVTDFAGMLKDSAVIRILYTGYSGGFTGNIKFAFIEGTPERNVKGIDRLWSGSYTFGNPADPIMNHIPVKTKTAPANTQTAELKYTVTGHGSDNTTQCCEFASHTYSVTLNGSQIAKKAIWRGCGLNELYPQGGTWIYDRANWCPGDAVHTDSHVLTGVTANSTYSVGVNYDGYASTGNYGSYTMEGHVVYYGGFNHTLDASLNDIVSPTKFEDYWRENPAGMLPVVKVHNSGSSTINSITFSYNVKDSAAIQYTWNGTLLSQQDTTITLAELPTLTNLSLYSPGGTFNFTAKIVSVNGVADEDSTNNTFTSKFVSAPTWPTSFIILTSTNTEGVGGVGSDPSETSWQISDAYGNIIFLKDSMNISTVYKDTITLPAGGFYKLTINDLGCDGLHWWVWDQNPSYGVTSGYLVVKKLSGTLIPMNGYTYSGTYHDDFGCGFTQNFTTTAAVTGIENLSRNAVTTMDAYPNPAKDKVAIVISGPIVPNGYLELMDGQGKIISKQKVTSDMNEINLSDVNAGVYTVIYRGNNSTQIQKRIAVVK